MAAIPRPALALGLAGVLPFAICALVPLATDMPRVQEIAGAFLRLYAVTILAFMSGCIWAFAARVGDVRGYGLSVLPALFGCFAPFLPVVLGWVTPDEALLLLAVGFVALLWLDRRAQRLGQTPDWWMSLRVLLTVLVVSCLVAAATI